MEKQYQKSQFKNLPGFYGRHTAGPDAANSTTDHLHLNSNRMILYFMQGSGNLVVEDTVYRVQAGDVIITDSSELFHCSIDPGIYHERFSLHIDPKFWENVPYDMSPLFHIFVNRKKGQGNLIPAEEVQRSGLGAELEALFILLQENAPNRDMLALSKLIQLLSLMAGLSSVKDTANKKEDPLLRQVLQHLNEHCTEDISVVSVAAHFHITPSFLAHWFKKSTGLSPWNYVILRRLQQANGFMSLGYSAEEACYRAGFDNYANFFRLYKKHTGIPPSQFKKQLR